MNLIIIISILLIHWIADYPMQDEAWAVNKSKNIVILFSHTIMYSLIFIIFGSIYGHFIHNYSFGILFGTITFICHTLTDYFTSKRVSYLFSKDKLGSSIPNLGAYSMIGFDQFLHYIQLFITFYYLS